MNLEIPSEFEQMREVVRKFVTRELRPHEQRVDVEDHVDPDLMAALRRRAVELGIYGFNLPASVGGGGVSPLGDALISEEMGRVSVALAEAIGRVPAALSFASPEQVEWLVKPVVRAEKATANALTEPDAGSDLSNIQTRGVPRGNAWIVSGSKQFVCGAENADFILVLAVTDPTAPLRRRFTTFIVDRKAPGLEMVTRFAKMGWRGLPMNAFALDGCVLGPERVLGEVGRGFATIMASVNTMRISIAARCVGAAGLLLEMSRDYALQRRTFGRFLGDHQAIQFKLADMDVEVEAARLLVLAGALKAEADDGGLRIAASRAKLFATEMAGRVADEALQLFGASGYMADLPIERMYRDLRGYRIGEGTSEMQRIQIARWVLGSR